MRALLGSCILTVSCSAAVAATVEQETVIHTCWGVVAVSQAIFSGAFTAQELDELARNIPTVASELSKDFPPAYNGISTGLSSAIENNTSFGGRYTASPSDRAAVLGVWCVNDTVQALNDSSNPMLQTAETQQQLVEVFKASIDHNVQQ